jgi:hypothetical protein
MKPKFEKTKVKFPIEQEITIFYPPAIREKSVILIPKNEKQLMEICDKIELKLFREQCKTAIQKHFALISENAQ